MRLSERERRKADRERQRWRDKVMGKQDKSWIKL